MSGDGIPRATYRLQLHRDFGFAEAAAIVPYLQRLGISHVYASPILKARSGSPHGYDIVDHNSLNPELGDADSFQGLVDTLHQHQMGLIVDIVPNHMGVGGADNAWWLHVLEHGQASPYAAYFDIDWNPVKESLRNKVLLPLLGDHYGAVLEKGELQLRFDAAPGEFSVFYYAHRLPIDPRSYGQIFAECLSAAADAPELRELVALCTAIPARNDPTPGSAAKRLEDTERLKQRLSEVCGRDAAVFDCLQQRVAFINGHAGDAASFDPLHGLLEMQAYRLAYWRVASDEINYRRFFDINELAGIRMEHSPVFADTHRLILQLVAQGAVDGLRIDHPDGLFDPAQYFTDLQTQLAARDSGTEAAQAPRLYMVVEKILAAYERLPQDWPVHGTTGYEFARLVSGLFVCPENEHKLDRIYQRFIGRPMEFEATLYECKKLIARSLLSSELTVLANQLDAIAQSSRSTRDFTLNGLREALTETVACFPVYRTYVTRGHSSDQDRRFVDWAIAQAKKRSPVADVSIFDFIRNALLLENLPSDPLSAVHEQMFRFVMRFQQYSAPVMAKAMEDTAMYIYNRLLSLNDVGGDPRHFGSSLEVFHYANAQRREIWPHAMIHTSTHDSKRGEDVHARLNVLSEMPEPWGRHMGRWRRLNRTHHSDANGQRAPSNNDEYLFYQTLLGTWPEEGLDAAGLENYRERIVAYMLKAVREAKVHTSWINPNGEYEQGVEHFARSLLRATDTAFVTDLAAFSRRVAYFGYLNGLAQTLLKLTAPGVPDIYQGNETWAFNLVDPDNRRAVDYARRQRLFEQLREMPQDGPSRYAFLADMLAKLADGRAKLYVTWKLLELRRERESLLTHGSYLALSAQGERAGHVCAFARVWQEQSLLVIAPRWFARLAGEAGELPPSEVLWRDTYLPLPEQLPDGDYRELFSNAVMHRVRREEGEVIPLHQVLAAFPVAVLTITPAAK